jgi:DNA-binding transcriptional LysR family regulator
MPVYVVYPPNRFRSAKVRLFVDWMIALLERDAGLDTNRP